MTTAERDLGTGGPGAPGRPPPPSRETVRRRRAVAAGVLAVLVLIIVVLLSSGGSSHKGASSRRTSARATQSEAAPARLTIRRSALTLPVALQDAASAPLDGQRIVLLGGLEAGETSTAAVTVLEGGRPGAHASLPEAQHDAQAAKLGANVYVFGGGQEASYDHILSFDPTTTAVAQAGTLPQPTSDAAVAAVGATAYVIGGYTGSQALDTIVAWRPGATAEVVAHLPAGLRYAAAATAADGRIVIAGGTPGEGASSSILRFDPTTRQVQQIGQMPGAITHASAFALGRWVYVVGGRGAAPGTQTASIVAIDSTTGHTVAAGQLPQPLSDAAVAVTPGRVWVAGGSSTSGVLDSILEIEPAAR
ncbi:MAG TPA: kelch repeat-containing protein [Solirubrobacteraceae bacterium]|nr:kelch repeat-containing protein [Solirubrobacteraceae bacterium]